MADGREIAVRVPVIKLYLIFHLKSMHKNFFRYNKIALPEEVFLRCCLFILGRK